MDKINQQFKDFLFRLFPYGELTQAKLQLLRDYYKFVDAVLPLVEDLRRY